MSLENDPKFLEWLKEKERKENQNNDFEQIPLQISIESPNPPINNEDEDDSSEDVLDIDVDHTVDHTIAQL